MIGILTVGLHEASGEVLPRFLAEANIPTYATEEHPGKLKPWFRHTGRRRQLMGFIITSKGEAISRILLQELKRGVTSIPGVGMYTGTSRSVLLCAVTVTEIAHMKALVRDQDPDAFVIVSPVQEILGGGFLPLINP